MPRLVVISNRVADPRKPAAGGLAVAVGESLQQSGGLWFGWSGTIVEDGPTGEGELHKHQAGKVMLATLDLSREDHDAYYLGYSNNVLWPVFHDRLDLANFEAGYIGGYRRVNQLFARKLLPLLRDDDILWVHDYHLIPLAAELRAMGCRQRIGFFLHIPLPPQIIMAAIPQHEWLMRSLFAYDVIGFQANQDVQHFERYVLNEAHGESLGDDMFRAWGNTVRASAFPIGIDVDEFEALTQAKDARDMYTTMKDEYSKRRLLLGIDRLDYSKGIPQRVRAFRELLAHYPENRRSATLIQIASPTREDVNAYGDIRRELESLCGAINGDYGELDWMPVRYIHRMVARKRVPGLCRAAAVGLVTPLRDGMNLVAKEFVAAQPPEDPGVLILSHFAGAAREMEGAVKVNPNDPDEIAEALDLAINMPIAERRERWRQDYDKLAEAGASGWSRSFLASLNRAEFSPNGSAEGEGAGK